MFAGVGALLSGSDCASLLATHEDRTGLSGYQERKTGSGADTLTLSWTTAARSVVVDRPCRRHCNALDRRGGQGDTTTTRTDQPQAGQASQPSRTLGADYSDTGDRLSSLDAKNREPLGLSAALA